MRRAFGPAMVLAVIFGVAAIGYAAFNAGVERGRAQAVVTQAVTEVEEGATTTTEGTDVVRVVDDRFDGRPPFFPGFFFFPLLVIGAIVFFSRRRGYGGPPWGPPGWGDQRAEEWHRRAHSEPAAATTSEAPAEER